MPDAQISECRDARCKARIIWATTRAGKRMPVDAGTADDGNIMLVTAAYAAEILGIPANGPVAVIVTNPAAEPLGGWPGTLHHSHFETCPGRDDWRKARTVRRTGTP